MDDCDSEDFSRDLFPGSFLGRLFQNQQESQIRLLLDLHAGDGSAARELLQTDPSLQVVCVDDWTRKERTDPGIFSRLLDNLKEYEPRSSPIPLDPGVGLHMALLKGHNPSAVRIGPCSVSELHRDVSAAAWHFPRAVLWVDVDLPKEAVPLDEWTSPRIYEDVEIEAQGRKGRLFIPPDSDHPARALAGHG